MHKSPSSRVEIATGIILYIYILPIDDSSKKKISFCGATFRPSVRDEEVTTETVRILMQGVAWEKTDMGWSFNYPLVN